MGNKQSHQHHNNTNKAKRMQSPPDPSVVKQETKQRALNRALVEATNNNNCTTMVTLLKAGANPQLVLYGAAVTKKSDVFEILYQHIPNVDNGNLLSVVIDRIEDEYCDGKELDNDMLLKKNGRYKENKSDDRTRRLLAICEYIILQDDTVIQKIPLDQSQFLLENACRYDKIDLLKLCIVHGIKPNFEEGILLVTAVEYDHDRIIKYLTKETNIWDTPNLPIEKLLE